MTDDERAYAGGKGGDDERAQVRRILRERARSLARTPETPVVEEMLEFVTLDLGGAAYAVEAEAVREVFSLRDMARLPTAPPWVLGITNVRGSIVAVVDLGAALTGSAARILSGQVVLVEVGGIELGIEVARCGVIRVPRNRLRTLEAGPGTFVKSVSVDDRPVLDLEQFVAETRRTAAPLAAEAPR